MSTIPSASQGEQRPNTDNARTEYIAGLRAFADWLESNPGVPAEDMQRMLLPLMTNAAVEEFAAEHGLTVVFDDEGNASCDAVFGRIVYHAYGYVDFAEHVDRQNERRARDWASRKGFEIREGGESK